MYLIILELRPIFNPLFVSDIYKCISECNYVMNINYFNVLYFFFQDNKTLRLNETHLVEVNVVSTLKWVLFSCAYMYVEMI